MYKKISLFFVFIIFIIFINSFFPRNYSSLITNHNLIQIEQLDFKFESAFLTNNKLFSAFGNELITRNASTLKILNTIILPYVNKKTRLTFVTSKNSILISNWSHSEIGNMYRLNELNKWEKVLNFPVWRMTSNSQGILFAGTYESTKYNQSPQAKLFRSHDDGLTWELVYKDKGTNHFHSVFTDSQDTLYIALGDGKNRRQAYSVDNGKTFVTLNQGDNEGHTDGTISNQQIIWGSDDGSGKVYLQNIKEDEYQVVIKEWGHYVWFTVSDENFILVGTVSAKENITPYLLASLNNGVDWFKVSNDFQSTRAYQGFISSSRTVSSVDGWVFVCSNINKCIRIRPKVSFYEKPILVHLQESYNDLYLKITNKIKVISRNYLNI